MSENELRKVLHRVKVLLIKYQFAVVLISLIFISLGSNLYFMKSFSVEPREIDENVTIGIKTNLTLSIKHIGLPQYSVNLEYDVDGINKSWIKLPNEAPPLKPNEIEFVGLTVDIPNGTIPGRYNGNILVKASSDQQAIKTSLNVIEAVSNEVVRIKVHQDW